MGRRRQPVTYDKPGHVPSVAAPHISGTKCHMPVAIEGRMIKRDFVASQTISRPPAGG